MNPELLRYLWLEMTPHRVLATPLVLAAVFGLVHLMSDGERWALAVAGWWIAAMLGVLWGARATSESVASEVLDGTWDQQRLSSVTPWSMTWGKLVGAPVFTWYAGAFCYALMVIGASARMPRAAALEHVALLALAVLFAHAVGLLVSVHVAAGGRLRADKRVRGVHMAGALAAAPLLLVAYPAFVDGWQGSVRWFGAPVDVRIFTWCTAAAFTVWAVIGCHRLMRVELALRNGPLAWVGFVAFCMAWVAGLAWHDGELAAGGFSLDVPVLSAVGIVAAHATALALGYASLFTEPKDPVRVRRLLAAVRGAQPGVMLEELPRWWWCALLAAITAAAALAATGASGAQAVCVSSLLFFARDAGIVMLLNLAVQRTRADAAALLYLALLYAVAPLLVEVATPWSAAGWLLPLMDGPLWLAVAPPALQAALVWALVCTRWTSMARLRG